MTQPTQSRIVYVVQRVGWSFNDEWFFRDGPIKDQQIAAYTRRELAEAELLRRERQQQAVECPFQYYGGDSDVECVSHLTEQEFVQFLASIGLTPRAATCRWEEWWEVTAATLTPEQHQAIWSVMTKVKFHEIVEVEMEG
jgi:hypothetical protein